MFLFLLIFMTTQFEIYIMFIIKLLQNGHRTMMETAILKSINSCQFSPFSGIPSFWQANSPTNAGHCTQRWSHLNIMLCARRSSLWQKSFELCAHTHTHTRAYVRTCIQIRIRIIFVMLHIFKIATEKKNNKEKIYMAESGLCIVYYHSLPVCLPSAVVVFHHRQHCFIVLYCLFCHCHFKLAILTKKNIERSKTKLKKKKRNDTHKQTDTYRKIER